SYVVLLVCHSALLSSGFIALCSVCSSSFNLNTTKLHRYYRANNSTADGQLTRASFSSVAQSGHVSTDEGTVADFIIFNGNTLKGRLCGTSHILHHAVGGSAASLSELSLVLQERAASALPELYTQLHPDSDPSNPALHSLFVELNEAYRVLSKDPSRKEYDFKMRHPYSGGPTFRSTSSNTTYRASADTQQSFRYWEQFRQSQAQEMTAEEWQRRRRRNSRLVGYCFITMVLSIGAHIVFFRKLEEVHNTFMDEKDRAIAEIYKESKERARANGFKKQTEILRQKHAEFLEKYNIRNDGDDK
uniref:DnaJ (Hsp40) homolog, subfamily C, member 4 n=1 Tax=Cyclopterus lumpus TaxID=8103 RepID=A0A8C2XPL2_CYCLU